MNGGIIMKKKNKEPKSFLTDVDTKPENMKANITIRISGELLNAYRAEAEKLGIGYQTLMQIKLKEGLENSIEKRLERLEKAIKAKPG
jgi:predicted DNA binding CopG/RHH family protein